MRTLRAVVATLLVLAVAALLAAWLAVPQLDVNRLRGQIVTLASARLGHAVGIEGKLSLNLLPQPTLIATDVTLPAGNEGLKLTARQLRVRIAIGPLLGGRVVAHDVVLQGADLVLPWPVDLPTLLRHAPHGAAGFSATLEDGQLHVGGVSVSKIDAMLRTDADTGTWRIGGEGEFAGQPWAFAAQLSRPGLDGSAALDARLDGAGTMQGFGGTLSGQLAGDGTLAGRLAGWGPRLAQVLPGPALPFRAEGRVTVAGGLAAADDLSLDIDGARARGAVALRVLPQARLDLALAASRLDLDAWLPALVRRSDLGLPTGLDLSAEAATLAGGTLRGLRCSAELTAAGSEITDARAVLPGDAAVRMNGRVQRAAGGARFTGGISVQAPALRTTLDWLHKAEGLAPIAALPQGVLREASFSARVDADATQVAMSDIAGDVDGSRLSGSLTLRGGARPAIGAGLTLDRLDLDPWLPARAPPLGAMPNAFSGFDAELRLSAKRATFHGVALAPLTLDAGAEGGKLTLRSLEAQVAGAHLSASAALAPGGLLSEGRLDLQAPQAKPLIALLPPRLAFLGYEAPALWQAAGAVQVLGSGAPDRLSLSVSAELGDLRLDAQPIIDVAHDTWSATVALRHPGAPVLLRALGFERAPDWLGEGSLGLTAKLVGAGNRITADTLDVSAGALHATGALALDGMGTMPSLTGRLDAETLPLPYPDLRVSTPLPLAGLLGWNAAVQVKAARVTAGGAPVLRDVAANAALSGGMVRLDALTGRLAGGALTGHAALSVSAGKPPELTGEFQVAGATVGEGAFGLPVDLSSGKLDAAVSLSATGYAPDALLATLGGTLAMTVANGTLQGVSLAGLVPPRAGEAGLPDAAVKAALAGGATPLVRLSVAANAARGIVTLGGGTMTTPQGHAELSGEINLPDRSLDLDVAFRAERPADAPAGAPPPPRIGVRLTGAINAAQRTPELADLIRWRAARMAEDPP
jgi:hypothetical protein